MRFFFTTIWIPYLRMWYNPKKHLIVMSVDDFMSYVKDWDYLDNNQKENQRKIWKHFFKKGGTKKCF